MAGPNCCNQHLVAIVCSPECPPEQTIDLQNVNLTGIGVLDGWNGSLGNFRGVASANAMIGVSLDNVNHTVLLTASSAEIIAALPIATTSTVGVGETATDAEALAKSATDKFVTPSNFAAMGSTTGFAGLIEIATLAEVQAGTATNLAVVPDTLADMSFLSLANGAANVMGGPATVDMVTAGGANLTFYSPGSFTGLVLDGATLNFTNGALVLFNGIPMDVETVFTTDNAGLPFAMGLNEFVSTANTSVWGAPTGIQTRTTFAGLAPLTFSNPPTQGECDALGIQVSIVQQRLAALITDLMATLKPHAT